MVRYYLGTHLKGKTDKFNINELNEVKTANSLQKIDNFTMNFSNEQELLKYLKESNLYNYEKNKKIYVIYTFNKKDKKLPVLYNDNKKYMSTEYLRYTLKKLATDIDFLEKLSNHFSIGDSKYNPQLSNVQILRGYVNEVRFSSTKEAFYSRRVYDALEDIFLKAIIKKIDEKTGEVEINYRGLRDLAIFVKKYIETLILKEEKTYDDEDKIRRFEYNEDYDEPDFPPNSEEEDMYLNYLESLPDEEPDYIDYEGKKL